MITKELIKTADSLPRGGVQRRVVARQLEFGWAALLHAAAGSEQGRDTLLTLLAVGESPAPWRGEHCVPPGSLIESIVNAFARGSSVPLDLPFFSFFAILAGELAFRKVVIHDTNDLIRPQLWMILLSGSGSGKTFSASKIKHALSSQASIPGAAGIVSDAALFGCLQQQSEGLILKDEFGKFVKKIERDEYEGIKNLLLDVYNSEPIERTSKKEGVVTVECPVISILGLSVDETWRQCVSAESMIDGFCQRFLYVLARPDPQRPGRDYPRWQIDTQSWEAQWKKIADIIHTEYKVSPEAIEIFVQYFRENFGALPESFFRRIARSAHTYALCYHLLIGDSEPTLTARDYSWAGRILALHLRDAAEVLRQNGLSELQRIIAKCETVIERKGLGASARDLVAGVREIRSASEARSILELIRIGKAN